MRIVTLVCFTVFVLLLFFYADRNFGLFYCETKVTIRIEDNNTTNTVKQTKVTIRIEKQQYYKHNKTKHS
jgi:hypothetical protein